MNRCPAHGKAMCQTCSRIAVYHISKDVGEPPQCDSCEYWGETGMHWDTCPNRIRGDIVLHPQFGGRW